LRIPGFGTGRSRSGPEQASSHEYQGSSFSELIDTDHPHLRLDVGRGGSTEGLGVPHGTTVLAFKYADGVIVAGDRLATEGLRVASRDMQKVYATDDHSLIAIAGAASSLSLDEGGKIADARVALAAVAPTPLLVNEITEFLKGKEPTVENFTEAGQLAYDAVSPIADMRGTIEQRRHLSGVLSRRTLTKAAERAKAG